MELFVLFCFVSPYRYHGIFLFSTVAGYSTYSTHPTLRPTERFDIRVPNGKLSFVCTIRRISLRRTTHVQ